MASAAEQLAANINFGAFAKATELKKRIWFTLAVLIVYRLGTYVPIPGIDPAILQDVFKQNQSGYTVCWKFIQILRLMSVRLAWQF